MPKVHGPLFSLKAAGTLAKTITYKKGVVGNVVRMFRIPRFTRNAAQSVIRIWFQRGVWTWQGKSGDHGYAYSTMGYGLEEPARASWREYRTTGGLFGYYAFMKRWMQRAPKGMFQYQVPPHFGFCVADEWLADNLIADGVYHSWS